MIGDVDGIGAALAFAGVMVICIMVSIAAIAGVRSTNTRIGVVTVRACADRSGQNEPDQYETHEELLDQKIHGMVLLLRETNQHATTIGLPP